MVEYGPLSSFNHYSAQYSFHWLLSHITIVDTTDSGERGMNPVAMTIINPRKEYWPSQGSNQRPPVLKSATLLTELWDLAAFQLKTVKTMPSQVPIVLH